MIIKSLRTLEVFLAVARVGTIRGAAEALGVTQPAVSAAIAELSRSLKTPVLEREGRGVVLTEAGRAFASYARRSLALLEEGRDAASAAAGETTRLRIAAVTTAAESFVPALFDGFARTVRNVDVELDVANRQRIWDRLNHDEVELVVAGEPPTSPQCRTLAVRANDLVVVAHPERALLESDLGSVTWLMRELGSGTRARTEEIFRSLGIAPRTLTIGSNGAVRECVRAGLGISLLSTDAIGEEIALGRLRVVPTSATPRRRLWRLVTKADRIMSVPARAFVHYALASGAFVREDIS